MSILLLGLTIFFVGAIASRRWTEATVGLVVLLAVIVLAGGHR